MAAESPVHRAPDPQPGPAEDVTCQGCGYNLRTLEPSGLCPECGTPVATSINRWLSEELPWMAQRAEGAALLAISFASAVILVAGCVLTRPVCALAGESWLLESALSLALPLIAVAMLAAGAIGLFVMSAAHPSPIREWMAFGRFSARRVLCLCAALLLAWLLIMPVCLLTHSIPAEMAWAPPLGILLLSAVAMALHLTILLRYTQHAIWERRARACVWGLALAELVLLASVSLRLGEMPTVSILTGRVGLIPLAAAFVVLATLAALSAVVALCLRQSAQRLYGQQQLHREAVA